MARAYDSSANGMGRESVCRCRERDRETTVRMCQIDSVGPDRLGVFRAGVSRTSSHSTRATKVSRGEAADGLRINRRG